MTSDSAPVRPGTDSIRARPRPGCLQCGTGGVPLYSGLRDLLFGAPGEWDMKRCPRHDCGLVWLDPQPVEEDIALAYRIYHTHESVPAGTVHAARRAFRWVRDGYLAARLGYPPPRPALLVRLLGRILYLFPDRRESAEHQVLRLHARPGGRVLDVGCGNGAALRFLRERGWRVEGVDFDPSAVAAAQRSGLEVRQGKLEAQGYAPASFDAVTMSHFLEHVYDPDALLGESHRILKPGGRLVVVTPNAAAWGHSLFGSAWRGLEPPRHLQIFTPGALRSALERAGFRQSVVRTSIHSRLYMLQQSLIIVRRDAEARGAGVPASTVLRSSWYRMAARPRMIGRPDGGEEIVALATR